MTEAEAKTKWCPFVRMTASQGEWHINRDPSLPSAPTDTQAYRCIGSACMAWRWYARIPLHVVRAIREETGVGMMEARKLALDMFEGQPGTGGYCGLAGTP